jgi:hypothetical protein
MIKCSCLLSNRSFYPSYERSASNYLYTLAYAKCNFGCHHNRSIS